jgi:anti-anti-sigma regulatory factor
MPIHLRIQGDVAILSNVGRGMNDPRYLDAGQEVRDLLGRGFRSFVVDLSGVHAPGPPLLGVLMTVTRQIRKEGGEVVLAELSRDMKTFLDEMRLEEFWDVYRDVEQATGHFLERRSDVRRDQ